MSITCSACGSLFRPQRSTARFCSSRCRKATQRARDRGSPIRVAMTRLGVAVDAVLSVTGTPGLSKDEKPKLVTLRRKPLKLDPRIVPDGRWPGMFRLRLPDGSLSDILNLTRAREFPRSHWTRGLSVRGRKWQPRCAGVSTVSREPARDEILVPTAVRYLKPIKPNGSKR